VQITKANFTEFSPPSLPTFLITNPPYGARLKDDSLNILYKNLGDFMKKNCSKPSKGFILTGDRVLANSVGLRSKKRHILYNGGLESRLLEFDIY
jgi:putative N6-adenine-specific DNA methylase